MVTLIVCIAVGLISGFFATQMLYRSHGGLLLNSIVGATGALIGYLFLLIGASPASGVTFLSVLVAIAGAIVLLGLKHAFLGNRPVGT